MQHRRTRLTRLSVYGIGSLGLVHTRADAAVAKATDENLTSENWEFILVRSKVAWLSAEEQLTKQQDVCDKVSTEDTGYDLCLELEYGVG